MTATSDRPLTERQEAVLLELLRRRDAMFAGDRGHGYPATGNELGLAVVSGARARRQRGPWSGYMGPAQRVIGTLNGLRNTRGLVGIMRRRDGMSGTAYALTDEGLTVAHELRAKNTTRETVMTDATIEELKAKLKEATGYEDEEEEAVAELDGWHYGERVRVLDDDEDEGIFAGDEGRLIISKVGSAEFGSDRVALYILPKGMSSPVEVQPDNIESAG